MTDTPNSNAPDKGGTETIVEPAGLKRLRRLVTVLMLVMIAGVLAVTAALVIRFASPPQPALPDGVSLPDGARASAVTAGRGWYAVVTEDQRLLVYDADTGTMTREIDLTVE